MAWFYSATLAWFCSAVDTRPGLPAVLAQEQAAAIAAAIGHLSPPPAEAMRVRSDDIEPAA